MNTVNKELTPAIKDEIANQNNGDNPVTTPDKTKTSSNDVLFNHDTTVNHDTSRISISAHYTGYVWFKNQLSHEAFATKTGRRAHLFMSPVNALLRKIAGADIDIFLQQRHLVIDHYIEKAIQDEGITQIVELACGLSPRGYRITQKYPHVHYIEADLPGMVGSKYSVLNQLETTPTHRITTCNILDTEGEHSIERVIAELDPTQKTLVITEGLVNYFDLPVIKNVWARIAKALSKFPEAWYVTDLYPNFEEHPSYRYVKFAQKLVGWFTKGSWPLHYSSDAAIREGFIEDGFNTVSVVDPAEHYHQLNIPQVDIKTLVRIIVCKTA